MRKVKEIASINECSIGQKYILIDSIRAESVTCKKLEYPNKATFEREKIYYSSETINFDSEYKWRYKVFEYNASLIRKYNKLLEQQEQERNDLLCNKEVIVYKLSNLEKKEKLLSKIWKKLKRKYGKHLLD